MNAADAGYASCIRICSPGVIAISSRAQTVRVLLTLGLLAAAFVPPASARELECFNREPTIVGTEGRDVLEGTPGDDVIMGLGGRDQIDGGAGQDFICGGDNPEIHDSEGRNLLEPTRGRKGW